MFNTWLLSFKYVYRLMFPNCQQKKSLNSFFNIWLFIRTSMPPLIIHRGSEPILRWKF